MRNNARMREVHNGVFTPVQGPWLSQFCTSVTFLINTGTSDGAHSQRSDGRVENHHFAQHCST